MTPEKPDQIKHEYKRSFQINESILVNDEIGITVNSKHHQTHIAILCEETMKQKTDHLVSLTFSPMVIKKLIITASPDGENRAEIKIKSDKPIQIVSYSYPQDFYKLFEYRVNKKKEYERLSGNITNILKNCTTPSLGDNPQPQ